MVKKKVLVTGGSGYIGARLSMYLANEGYSVTALCHSNVPIDENWISLMDRVLIGDVRDENFLLEIAEYKYDILIHLVSLDHHQSNGSPLAVSAVNITPVWLLLDIFSKHNLSKFIYFSTAQVYGLVQNEIVLENRMMNTQNAYGLTHHIGEVICEHYNRNSAVDCRVVRLSNSYGAPIFKDNNCWWLVINDLCRMAYLQKKIVLKSDGSPMRDFIHGWDVCRGVLSIIETSELHTTYNLSSGETLSILDIAQIIKKVFEQRYNIELQIITGEKQNESKPNRYTFDNSLMLSIGFEPKLSIKDGINDLFDYFEKNKDN